MLEKAKLRPFVNLIQHNLEDFPYPLQHKFNVVVCIGVMDFIERPREFLTYIKQSLLNPGGLLGISIPERHAFSDLSSFSRTEMDRLILEGGFSIERHERVNGYTDSQSGNRQFYHVFLLSRQEETN